MKLTISGTKSKNYEILGLSLVNEPFFLNILNKFFACQKIYTYDITLLDTETGNILFLTIELPEQRDINTIYDLEASLKAHKLDF